MTMSTEDDNEDAERAAPAQAREKEATYRGSTKKEGKGDESSTGSSGKSDSRGGYSADCSASDQSSDDSGRKTNASKLGDEVGRINLDETDSDNASGSRQREDDNKSKNEATGVPTKRPSEPQEPEVVCETERPSRKKEFVESKRKKHEDGNEQSQSENGSRKGSVYSNSSLDLEAIQNFKRDARERHRLDETKPLPQVNGVRISHPMDPRIDLSRVSHLHYASVPANYATLSAVGKSTNAAQQHADSSTLMPSVASLDAYGQLLEMVKPFYGSHGIPLAEMDSQVKGASSGEGTTLSEGFTSFFTTTASNNTSSPSHNSSDLERKQKAGTSANKGNTGKDLDDSDTSSLVVLARVKRKHRANEGESGSSLSTSSGEKRVRIQEANRQAEGNPSHPERQLAPQASSSSSADSSSRQNADGISVPLAAVVTEASSSSNRTDSAGTSSSGQAASGSNVGSSGSNEERNSSGSNEERGASSGSGNDEQERSGDDPKKPAHGHVAGGPSDPTTVDPYDPETRGGVAAKLPIMGAPSRLEQEEETSVRGRLLDKKRKRLEMRREYEAQQRSESSTSIGHTGDQLLRPGRPVTLDQVLFFSKIPRVVVQSTPPFLVVHVNAAFCRLTGLEAHVIISSPIGALLAVPNTASQELAHGIQQPDASAPQSTEANEVGQEAAQPGGDTTEAAWQVRHPASLERLVLSSGYGRTHVLHITAQTASILGRNVTVVNPSAQDTVSSSETGEDRRRGAGGTEYTNSSIIPCRASIAPVVSVAPEPILEREHELAFKAKRRKATHDERPGEQKIAAKDTGRHRRPQHRHIVTHYVIQLDHQQHSSHASAESLSVSSTSLEARNLNMSKAGLLQQRAAIELPAALANQEAREDDEVISTESTSTKEPVVAVA